MASEMALRLADQAARNTAQKLGDDTDVLAEIVSRVIADPSLAQVALSAIKGVAK